MVARRDFTDRYLRSLKPAQAGKRIVHYDGTTPQFGIRVTDKSSAENVGSFVLVARFPGSPNPTARRIGDYPEMSLSKARGIAREWRDDIAGGIDPKVKEQLRLQDEAKRRADTFKAAFEAFATDHLATLRTGSVVKAAVVKHVYPVWADRPLSDIKRADVIALVRTLKQSAPIGANRVLAYLKKFFAWAVDQDMREDDPAISVKRPSKENERDRVLTEAEIKAIWLACEGQGVFGRAFRMMLLTGQRRTEVAAMTWAELNLAAASWTIPRERTKADRAQEVPLSSLAVAIIKDCPKINGYVFTTGRSAAAKKGGHDTCISGWGKGKEAVDKAALIDGKPLPPWHLHDLRRTCATYLAKLGVDRMVISKVLNHAEGGVTHLYDRHRYDGEKRRALQLWADHLAGIVGGFEIQKVVSLSAKAA